MNKKLLIVLLIILIVILLAIIVFAIPVLDEVFNGVPGNTPPPIADFLK